MSITSIENLSNECFYEIFEYFNGYEIFHTFSNLNYRFQQLLNSSSLLFKLNFNRSTSNELYMNIYQQLLLNNKHQILSFHLCSSLQKTEFLSSFSIDSLFDRLESLVIIEIPPFVLSSLLTTLSSLPRLFSLTIDMRWSIINLTEVYQFIFTLSKLKYLNCSSERSYTSVLLPIATDEQFIPIEYFDIDHDCTLNEFCTLISYTPQLRHLNLNYLSTNHSNNEIILPFTFPNLKYLSIEMSDIEFDDLETFIIETECNLKVLRVITFSENRDYLHANRWEQLIVNYLPELKEFYLQYHQSSDPESGMYGDFKPPNQFNSSFWSKHKWVLEIEADPLDYLFTICSYKQRWYDEVDSSKNITDSTRLILSDLPDDERRTLLKLIICDLLAIAQIYHLEISKEIICSDILVDLIYKLSAIHTLKIVSLNLSKSNGLCIEDKNLRFVSKKNNITKVYLEKMSRIEEVYFLIQLCPCMVYLKVNFINDMDIVLFFKNTLKKINEGCNQSLRSMCIHVPSVDDEMIQKLKETITGEKLLHHFTIKCVLDNIDLQWR